MKTKRKNQEFFHVFLFFGYFLVQRRKLGKLRHKIHKSRKKITKEKKNNGEKDFVEKENR